jgi:hypothetical protein
MATDGTTLRRQWGASDRSIDSNNERCGEVYNLDRLHGDQGQWVRASSLVRWTTKSALTIVAVVTAGNLATGLAFSETAVRSRVARAMYQSSKLPLHHNEPLAGAVADHSQ